MRPIAHRIPQWDSVWHEVDQPIGDFRCWQASKSNEVIGETQPYPPDHPRATTLLKALSHRGADCVVEATIVHVAAQEFFVELAGLPAPTAVRMAIVLDEGKVGRAIIAARELTSTAERASIVARRKQYPDERSQPIPKVGQNVLASAPFTAPVGKSVRLTFASQAGMCRIILDGKTVVEAKAATNAEAALAVGLRSGLIRLADLTVGPRIQPQ